jgi:hypothetical protein
MWHLVEPVDFVMEKQMLHGIKSRVEAGGRAAIERSDGTGFCR